MLRGFFICHFNLKIKVFNSLFKGTLLQKNFDMDKINEFLNHKLPENFLYDDDQVIDMLEICIEKLLKQKFDQGSLIEAIPISELPKVPFGDFKKIDTRPKVTEGESSNKDRDAFVEQIAKEKIELEKKKREEIKLKKQEERRMNENASKNGDFKEYIEDGGKPIRNISDEDEEI